MTILPDGRADGERRRDAAHDLLAARRRRIIRDAQRALVQRVLTDGTATADDVRAAITLPNCIDPVCLGAAPSPLARLGIIRRVGYVKTARWCANARPLSVWELADRAAGEAWLKTHPAASAAPSTDGDQRLLFDDTEGAP